MKIQRLQANALGRDFVCGDIHGSYSRVTQFLEAIKFDLGADRLICVGDLVDRGPENEACLALLDESWFYAVRGNHEQLMTDFFTDGPYGEYWVPNGGAWGVKWDGLAHTDGGKFIKQKVFELQQLPVLLTVEKRGGGVFHVLHAELPPVEGVTDETLADPDQLRLLATRQSLDGDYIIWGRYIFNSVARQRLDEYSLGKFRRAAEYRKFGALYNDQLSHIYSGHTIMQRPVRFKGQTNLDTCAYGSYNSSIGRPASYWCGLTVTEPATDKFWLVNDSGVQEVQPVVV